MIDVEAEQLIPLAEARSHPALRNPRTGKPANPSTVFRHAIHGAKAVNGERIRLETVKLPSGLVTSSEAIVRFISRLTDPEGDIPTPTPKQRQRELAAASAELEAAGMI